MFDSVRIADEGGIVSAILFDREQVDHLDELPGRPERLKGSTLLGSWGLNFKVDIFETTWLFYLVLAVFVAIAPLTFAAAKLRDWI